VAPSQRRLGILFAVFLGLLGLAALRTAWVGLVRGDDLQAAAATQQVSTVELPARRGSIRDRHGVELAVSEPAADIAVTPYLVKDPARAAHRLAPLLQRSADDVLRDLSRRDTGFVYLARAVPAERARKVERLEVPGVQLIPGARREYPRGGLASQVLGTVGTDGEGLSGLEYAHERLLRGRDGERRLVKDALGEPIDVQDTEPEQPGRDVTLTLDAAIQGKVEEVLQDVGRRHQPKGATALVLDPRSSEVLAMANWPRVDANDVAGAPPYATQNRAVGEVYEPGSTFKVVTVAGALEEGVVEPGTDFDLAPTIQVADRTIGESHERGYQNMTVSEILAQSSNVGTITIGQRLGERRFDGWVRRFGFGRRTGIDLPGEESGLVLPLERYSGSSMGNLPIGQGEAVTPVQLASAYAAIANGGTLRPPRVLRAVDGRPVRRPAGRRIISEETAAEVRTMLEGVVRAGGTATEAAIPGYTLAGKTGTANKVDPDTGVYSKERYVASFAGFAPARDPQLLVIVTIDEPKGTIWGGEVAAPAFQQIAQFALTYLRIPPE
jgi:cell division protein FtsI/penicillin-binding protein 2